RTGGTLALPPGRFADRVRHAGGEGRARARGGHRIDRSRSAGQPHHRVPEAGTLDLRADQRRAEGAQGRGARIAARGGPPGRGVPHDHAGRGHGGALVNGTLAIFRRELRSYFATPVAYVFIVIFLLLSGAFTFYLGG